LITAPAMIALSRKAKNANPSEIATRVISGGVVAKNNPTI